MVTLAIIKPDAVKRALAGKIVAHLEGAGFAVRAARLIKLSTAQAEAFYEVHRERPCGGEARHGAKALCRVQGAKRNPRVGCPRHGRPRGGVFLPRWRAAGPLGQSVAVRLTQVPQGFSFGCSCYR